MKIIKLGNWDLYLFGSIIERCRNCNKRFFIYHKCKSECEHQWQLTEKWQDQEKTYWEFYCIFCLDIELTVHTHKEYEKELLKNAK